MQAVPTATPDLGLCSFIAKQVCLPFAEAKPDISQLQNARHARRAMQRVTDAAVGISSRSNISRAQQLKDC